MTWYFAIFLGLVQGLAEFLPISSSGHLAIFQNLFNMENVEQSHLLFDVMLHLGTLIAVFIAYRHEIWDILKAFAGLFKKRGPEPLPAQERESRRMILLIVIATLPLLVILPIKKYIESLYGNTIFVGAALIVTGCLLFLGDRIVTGKRKNARSASVADALIVGAMQAVAVVPGISRSGSTITAGLMRGFDREFAVRFSFLLSIPAVLGANILSLVDAIKADLVLSELPIYLLGVAVAAVAGYFAIGLVRMLTRKGKFGNFAYYCWCVGAAAILATLIF